jgi:hypothetical protein
VRTVCERAIRLDHGRLVDEGDAGVVVDRYLRAVRAHAALMAELDGTGPVRALSSVEALAGARDSEGGS